MDIPVRNNGRMPLYVGGIMVPPGETRILPAHHVPEHLRPVTPTPAIEAPPDPLAVLLEENVATVKDSLATLSTEELARVEQLETAAGSPRKGVLDAVAAERLARARTDELMAEAQVKALAAPDAEAMAALLADYQEHPAVLEMIRAIQVDRFG